MAAVRSLYIYIGIAFVAIVVAIVVLFITGYPGQGGSSIAPGGAGTEEIRSGSTVLAYVIRNPNYTINSIDVRSNVGNITLPIKGKVSTMTFQYLRCPDFCHWETYVYVYLMNKTAATGRAGDVVFVTIDVDPWRDTFEDIASYQKSRAGKLLDSVSWVWVLEDPDKMTRVWEDFRVFVARDPSTGLITHSAGFYIFDREGRLVYIIQPTREGWSNLEALSRGVWDMLSRVLGG